MDYIRRPSCRRCCRNRFDQSLPGNRYKRANRYKIHQRRHPSSSAPMFADRYTEIHRRPPIGGFRTDSTNNSLDYVRNKIRHQIIPVLKEINPSFLDTMTENCETLKETEEIFQYGIHRFQEEILDCEEDELLIHISKTLATPAPYTFYMKPWNLSVLTKSRSVTFWIRIQLSPANNSSPAIIPLERGRIFWRLYDNKCSRTIVSNSNNRYLYDRKTKSRIYALPVQKSLWFHSNPISLVWMPTNSNFPCLSVIGKPETIFVRSGWKSKKKLQWFFRDQKFSSKQKQECLLLLSDEKIAWIIGNRPDDRFKITSFTSNILQISIL